MDRCRICHSQKPRKTLLQLHSSPAVDYLECMDCLGCSVSHMPKKEYLADYYRDSYADADNKVTIFDYERFCNNVLDSLHLPSNTGVFSILDFGGGDGSLSLYMAKRLIEKGHAGSVHITIIEYVDPQKSQYPHISISREQELSNVTSQFDLVLASAILEHIPDLQPVLQGLLNAIKPGGFFYARTPYSLPMKRLFKDYDMLFPRHVHDLGAPFWNKVLTRHHINGRYVFSRPSLVQTRFWDEAFRTVMAYLFKLPARLELWFRKPASASPLWPYVGGWEVLIQRA